MRQVERRFMFCEETLLLQDFDADALQRHLCKLLDKSRRGLSKARPHVWHYISIRTPLSVYIYVYL